MEGWRHFQLADEEIDSTTQVIDIAGDATEYTVPELKEPIVELIASGKDRMLVDKRSTRVKTLRLNARDTVAKFGDMDDRERREFHEALLDADSSRTFRGRVAGGDRERGAEPSEAASRSQCLGLKAVTPVASAPACD